MSSQVSCSRDMEMNPWRLKRQSGARNKKNKEPTKKTKKAGNCAAVSRELHLHEGNLAPVDVFQHANEMHLATIFCLVQYLPSYYSCLVLICDCRLGNESYKLAVYIKANVCV